MLFKNQHDRSIALKSLFLTCIAISVAVSIGLMFSDLLPLFTWLQAYQLSGDFVRRVLIAACLIIYFLRLQVTVWIFQKRRWTLTETFMISILVSFALFVFARIGGNNPQVVGIIEMTGVFLYLSGSYVNTVSETTRHIWKLKAQNKGRLYTGGLFRFAMHINYFGDIVLFFGFAMITHRAVVYIIPLVMTLNFIFKIIPALDRYLEKKYGAEFTDYAGRTKKLVPLIY